MKKIITTHKYTQIFWALILTAVLTFIIINKINETQFVAKSIIDAALKQDTMFRYWASSHGGVYVKVSDKTPPNKNLEHIPNRDIHYNGLDLTLMNPAYMLRQMMSEYEGLYGLKGHITSLKTLNAEYNSPDSWEKKILLEKDKTKNLETVYDFITENDKKYLRAFIPLETDESCLKCHAFQGYEVGDIRGGVSATLPMNDLLTKQNQYIISIVFSFIAIYLIGFFVIRFFYNRALLEIEKQNELHEKLIWNEKYFRSVVNTSKNIIVVNNNKVLESVNDAFYLFTGYDSLDKFKEKYECICDLFVEKEGYLSKVVDGLYWLDYIRENPNKIHKAMIVKNGELYIFSVNMNEFTIGDSVKYVAALNDVTELVKKDEMILVQSKMAAMGEMLENIAHQWRQPLSVISTTASGVKLQKEFGDLSDEFLLESLDGIMNSTMHLSNTIDEFRDFFKSDKEKSSFDISNTLKRTEFLLSSKFKNRNIHVIANLEKIEFIGYENEMIQAFMNILNNAKDALEEVDQDNKLIFIDIDKNDDSIKIVFKDNAGGIPDEYIKKVFDQRFTTKEDRNGTGIGLYMTRQIIEKANGKISAQNVTIEYEGKNYKGAQFTIILPIIEESKK